MSNLVRGQVDYLLNTLTAADFGSYLEGDVTTGAKHLVLKKLGYDLVGANTTALVKQASLGQKMKRTLTLTWVWNGEGKQLFEISVTRQPLVTSVPEEQFPRTVPYNFLMTGFTTVTPGTLLAADKDKIINGLIAAIAADIQLTPEAVLTGAVVVGTNPGSTHTLVLESLERGKIFTCQTDVNQFTQPTIPDVGYMKDKLTTDDVMRIFSIKEENIGSWVNIPQRGIDYACITLKTKTAFPGIDLPSSFNTVEQKINLYTPVSQLALLVVDLYVANGDNAAAMAGTTPSGTIVQLLTSVCTGV